MALITEIDSWNDKIATAKANFVEDLNAIEALDAPIDPQIIDRLRSAST